MPILPALPVPETAATTPRLGLMNPVGSDFFKSSDFTATTEILDAIPGTLPVANLAALKALSWGQDQHGTRVLQLDNGAEWYWYQPSSAAGTWKRTNSIGILSYAILQGTHVSTTAVTDVDFLTLPPFTAPGVRPLLIDYRFGCDNTSGLDGVVIVSLWSNNARIMDWNVRPGTYINSNGVGQFVKQWIFNPTAGASYNMKCTFRSAYGQSAANGFGGTSSIRSAMVVVSEG